MTTIRSVWISATRSFLATLMLIGLASAQAAVTANPAGMAMVDLPPCEAYVPGAFNGLSIGVVEGRGSSHVVDYVGSLTLSQPSLNVCAESWSSVLPRLAPWTAVVERGHGWAAFALAFLVAVTILWFATPRVWWRRTTLLGILVVGTLTWGVGVTLLAGFHAVGGQRLLYDTIVSLRLPQEAAPTWMDVGSARELEAIFARRNVLPVVASPEAGKSGLAPAESKESAIPVMAESVAAPRPTERVPYPGPYRVAHPLNLREGPGVHYQRLTTLARGDEVLFNGAVQGDWWRVRAASGQTGWSSSLWLRRPAEGLPPNANMAREARS